MRKWLVWTGTVGFLFLVFVAASAPEQGMERTTHSPQSQPGGAPQLITMDQLLGEAGAVVSGFGGLYLDKDDNTIVYVYMLDTSQEAEARVAATSVLGPQRPVRDVHTLQAQYSMTQLKEWYDRSWMEVIVLPGVVGTDLQEGANRLLFGIESEAVRPSVEKVLTRLGVPLEAVIIEIMPPYQSQGHETLQGRVRPLIGGLEQSYSTIGQCSYGFTVLQADVRGAIIAAHFPCTIERGQIENPLLEIF
jgi:hypothetical protein